MIRKFARTHFPKTRLSKLIARSGGISQYTALENASKNMEAMREQGDEFIMRALAEIGDIVNVPRPEGMLSEAELSDILTRADQIVTLAETFCLESLTTVAKSLCDLADGFLKTGIRDLAPVSVHVQALIMVAPGSATISDAGFQIVLGELSKVRKHFNIDIDADVNSDSLEQATL